MKRLLLFMLCLGLAVGVFATIKMCIDPGHGGSDPGAVGYVVEKDIVLDTGLKYRDWMNLDTQDTAGGTSWSVYMTRSTDVYVSLQGRCDYANNNNVNRFLSIHANSADSSSAHGSETYCYYSGSSYSFDMRNKVQEELIEHGGLYNRGTKTAGYYVLRHTNMPAALTELGFVSNYTDSLSLSSASWRKEVAKGFLHALQRHYGYAAYTPEETIEVIVDDASSDFSASDNWWVSTWSSEKYGSGYHVRSTEYVSDPARFKADLSRSDTFKVYAWWTSGSNRASSAPYIIYASDGSHTVHVNQQVNGGQWVLLGTYSMNSGYATRVALSCWTNSGTYVIADAIKLVSQ